MIVWEFTTLFLRLWLIGSILIVMLAISDVVFRKPHGWLKMMSRLSYSLVWPLALFSTAGRNALLGKFEDI